MKSLQDTNKQWIPKKTDLETSNPAVLCKKLGLQTFAELHQWSVEHREEYWKEVCDELPILFKKNPTSYIHWNPKSCEGRYLDGAILNIVESCFMANSTQWAIVEENENGNTRRLTYADLKLEVEKTAAALVEVNIKSGDPIAIAMPMTTEAVIAYLAALWIGAPVVSIADSFAPDEIKTRLELSAAKLIVTQDVISRASKTLPMYEKVKKASERPCIVVPTQNTDPSLRTQDLDWFSFLKKHSQKESAPIHYSDPMATLNILFSSGTTGDPKVIPWNHATPIKVAADAKYHHNIQESDVLCWPTNLGWMMGPWLVFAALLNKATIALYSGSPLDHGFANFVSKNKVSMLGVVPSLVKTWRQNAVFENIDLSSLKVFSSTGECSNPSDMSYLMSLANDRCPIIEYCGGTEIGGAYITSSVMQNNRPSIFTTAALGLDFVLLDEKSHPASTGEVFIIPPSLGLSTTLLNRNHFDSYYSGTPLGPNNTRLRKHGDEITKLKNHGGYQALGRSDDTMNLGGIKVSSAEIERSLTLSGLISESAAIALSPAGGGPSQLVIFVVPNSAGPSISTEQLLSSLQKIIKEKLNPLFKIHDLVIVDSLPRTASNKVMRRVLRDQYIQPI